MTPLWKTFVFGWLLVLAVTAGFLVVSGMPVPRLALSLLGVVAIAALYLWITLREALGPGDLDPGGPSGIQVRQRLLLLGGMALLVTGVTALAPDSESWWLAQHVVIAAGLALPFAVAAWVTGVVTGLGMLGTWYLNGRPELVLLILLAFGAAAVAIRQLTINVAQLAAAQDQLARTAVDQERLRFARDLHDLLGHTLSMVVIKSELAGRLLPGSPDRAALEIQDVEHSAREALQQVRTAVAGYRQPVLASELAGAREMLAAAGIDSVIDPPIESLPATLDGLLAWAVREGVTNVIRHSRARHCEIRIQRSRDLARLTVADDGQGIPDEAPSVGSGLAGLAERVAALGATMSASGLPEGGFQLLVVAPVGG